MTTNPSPNLRTYSDESLLAAVARHAKGRGLTMDLAYRTTCGAPAELLIGGAQLQILIAELERRDVGGASVLFARACEFFWPPHPHVGEVVRCELPAGHSGWHRASGLTWAAHCFRVYGTGHPVDINPGLYVGTYQQSGGSLIFHLFDQGDLP